MHICICPTQVWRCKVQKDMGGAHEGLVFRAQMQQTLSLATKVSQVVVEVCEIGV